MRIFISYSRADSEAAESIAATLRQAGHRVFFDTESMQASDDYNRVIWAEIKKTDLFLFLISSNYIRPGSFALTELAFAEKRWPDPTYRVLPVELETIDLSQLPVYATICHILQPEGNLAAEVRAEVNRLNRRHRRGVLARAVATLAAVALVGALGWKVYTDYLSGAPARARVQLKSMGVDFEPDALADRIRAGDQLTIELFLTAGIEPLLNKDEVLSATLFTKHWSLAETLLDKGARPCCLVTAVEQEIPLPLFQRLLQGRLRKHELANGVGAAATLGRQDHLRLLLDQAEDTDRIAKAYRTAAYRKRIAVMKAIDADYPVDTKARGDALVAAANEQNNDIIEYLVSTELPDEAANEALLASASRNNLEAAKMLVPLMKEDTHVLAEAFLKVACRRPRGQPETMKSWLETLVPPTEQGKPYFAEAFRDNPTIVPFRCLIELGRTGQADNERMIEALRISVAAGIDPSSPFGKDERGGVAILVNRGASTEVIAALLELGADINHQSSDGSDALTTAAAAGHLEQLRFLLKKGIDAKRFGPRALRSGIKHPRVVKVLLNAGVDTETKGEDGSTPLIVAAKRPEAVDTLRLLLRAGAKVDAEDELGRTALDFARKDKNQEAIRLLTAAAKKKS